MKQQLNVRISDATREKLDHLTDRHGTQTEAVAIAINRLYEKEKQMSEHKLSVPENAGRGLTDYIATCSCGARFRCTYTNKGLIWQPLNDAAESCPFND